MSIRKNLSVLLDRIAEVAQAAGRRAEEISLVGMSKGKNVKEIEEAYSSGLHDFGESRVQEALIKMPKLPEDIRWHYVGKLQKNKIGKAIGRFVLIHSVDTFELAERISEVGLKAGQCTNILLQANTSGEESKEGLSPNEWEQCFSDLLMLKGIELHGLMTLAPLTEDEGVIRHAFSELRLLRDRLQERGEERVILSVLSMGMSNDYPIAIQEGSTILRIGSALFAPQ